MTVCYRYDGTFGGFLTCVFESYAHKEEAEAFVLTGDPFTLWDEREVSTDPQAARRVYDGLRRNISPDFQRMVARGFLTCLPQRELALYRFIRRGFAEGDRVRRDLTDPHIADLVLALRKLETEEDHLRGFVRFSVLEGALVGEIAPKNRVLPLLAPHFAGRFPAERIVLYDRTHREALLCDRGRWDIVPAEDFHMGRPGREEEDFRRMWRGYFDSVTIQERLNPKCQDTHIPKRYRGVMTEFQAEDAGALAPGGSAKQPPAVF